ncbi:MAG: restriction endonuclease subunit S [Candidatus Nitrotoga sp.]
MASSFELMQLGNVIRFGNGKAIKPGGIGRYPVFGSNGIIGNSDEFRYENGIIIGRVGAYCGSVGYCQKKFWASDNTLVAFPANDQFDTRFIFYLLHNANLGSYAGGAAQPLVTQTVLKQVEVKVPLLPIQHRIASILSAYDELIENNQRRIRILEEMARSLYREWFVHFRYPGHESVPLVDSRLGQIPQGWAVKKLADLTSFLSRGLSPSYDDDGASLVINQKCIRDQRLSLEPARRQKKPISEDKKVRFGDVLINSTGVGTLGRVAQVYSNLELCTVDTHVTIARSSESTDLDFFGCVLMSQQENFERLGVGATGQTELGRAVIGQVELITPPNILQARFGVLVRPMRVAATTLSSQTDNLRRTRDLLLPRLLSGQVQLEDAMIP